LSEATSLHPFELHAPAVREPGGDVAAGKTRLMLRHLLLRTVRVCHHDARRPAAPESTSGRKNPSRDWPRFVTELSP